MAHFVNGTQELVINDGQIQASVPNHLPSNKVVSKVSYP